MAVQKGTKIEPDDAAKMDRSKMAVLIQRPKDNEVEGQALYEDLICCPWCGCVGWTWIDTDEWLWVTCGCCGYSFQA